MKQITLLSDTHGYLDEALLRYCQNADEIWHAGDIGSLEVSDKLAATGNLRAVYGNIDGPSLRKIHPPVLDFTVEEVKVTMIHIGGYPGHYSPFIKDKLIRSTPDLLICGHSHILKVMRDKDLGQMLYINPGAAGKHGFHKVRTLIRFKIDSSRIFDLEIIELGNKQQPV